MLDKNEERMKIEDWWRFRSEITSDTCPTRKQTDRNGLFITGSHYTEKYSGRGRGNHDKQMSIVESSRSLLIVYVYPAKTNQISQYCTRYEEKTYRYGDEKQSICMLL